MLASTICTEHLELVVASEKELLVLDKLYAEVLEHFAYDKGQAFTSPAVGIRHGALPAHSFEGKDSIYCIYHKGHIIGYIELYLGLPVADNVYISFLYVAEAYQGKGFEQEALDGILEAANLGPFKTARTVVSLKDWQGMTFWQKQGFDTIISIDSEHRLSPDSFGLMELQYII